LGVIRIELLQHVYNARSRYVLLVMVACPSG
jgi:hypothetical protein